MNMFFYYIYVKALVFNLFYSCVVTIHQEKKFLDVCVANACYIHKFYTDRHLLLQEKVSDSSLKPPVHIAGRPNVPPYPLPALPIDDDEISSKGKSQLILTQLIRS